jgi:ATP-dependent Clp protease protease subunit
MPEIDISGLFGLRLKFAKGPQARSSRLAFVKEAARLDILGDIDADFGISLASMLAQLDAITAAEIRMRINSYGGWVLEGVAIHNALIAHPAKKTAEIFGVAASAASWIAMAADEIVIWEGAMMMIHQSWQDLIGNADVLEAAAAILRKIDQNMAAAYVRRTGLDDAEIRAMMKTETWLTAEEAVTKGFADRMIAVGENAAIAARAEIEKPRPASGINVSPEFLARLQGVAAAMTQTGGSNAGR